MLAVVVLLVAAGCATIPTHGPVGKSAPLNPGNNPPNVAIQQFGPEQDATPEGIIRGFIETGTGISDDFQTARQFLTGPLAQSWSPDERTLVYKGTYQVTPAAAKDSYNVKFNVVSTVDANGVLTPGSGTSTLAMSVVQVDGQWRIDKAPDGIVLAEDNFQVLFNPVSLYFYDPTFTYGVPDVRWIAGRTLRTATSIVSDMLAGPAPYLKGAVLSAFPTGMALERDSVPVNNNVAKVGLSSQMLLATSVRQRQQMHAQLLVTLSHALSNVSDVQFFADDREVDMGGGADTVPPPLLDNAVPSVQVALAKNELVTFDGSTVKPIAGMASIAGLGPSAPAVSYSGTEFAFLSGDGNKAYRIATGQAPVVAATGANLTPPSFSPNGWLWTANGDGSGVVQAFGTGEKGTGRTSVIVPWLVGRQVTTFRVSRDGTRALVIYSQNGASHVAVTGIVKTAEAVKSLNEPILLDASGAPTLGVWTGESSVAVMAPSTTAPVQIQLLDLAREPVLLSELPGVEWLSAGSGPRDVYAQTSGEIYTNVGNSWEVSAKSLSQASFAG